MLQIIVVDVFEGKAKEIRPSSSCVIRKGCLSMPGYTGNVLRYDRTVWKGMTPEAGVPASSESALEALAFQHELDHGMAASV